MDCIVHGVSKSQTRLSNFHFHFLFKLRFTTLKQKEKLRVQGGGQRKEQSAQENFPTLMDKKHIQEA